MNKKFISCILLWFIIIALVFIIFKFYMQKEDTNITNEINENTKSENLVEKENFDGVDKLYYLWHASLRITTNEGKVIYIDPYMWDNYDLDADLVLITHGHFDHNDLSKVKNRADDFQIITYEDAIVNWEHLTFDLGYAKIISVEAWYNRNHDREKCVWYVLEFTDWIKIYVPWDTSITPQMEEIGTWNIDYAFIPCDWYYTMSLDEAAEAAKLVNAKHTIPYHMTSNWEAFDESVANQFDAENKLIVKPNTEITLK